MPCLSTLTLLFHVENLWLRRSKNIGEGRFQRCYVAKLCLLMEPRSHPSLCSCLAAPSPSSRRPRSALFFMLWCYCLEDILRSPLPPVFRSPSNIHACSILGLKIQFPPPVSLLIQPIGLLGKRVAGSMTHPDAGELSSLIINTLGSYELKKEMRGGVNLI